MVLSYVYHRILQSVTMVASVWGSGERGPCFINCKQGTFPVAAVEEFNDQLKGRYFIYQGSENTHMMDGDATCVMYERLFTDAFKLQRTKWDMPTRRGGLLCDAATINDCAIDGSDIRRRKFSESCNVALPLKKPGGWRSMGQPVDAFVNHARRAGDNYEDRCLGLMHNLLDRPPVEEFDILPNGHVARDISVADRFAGYRYMIEQIPQAVYMWAVTSRGMATHQELMRIWSNTPEQHQKLMEEGVALEDPGQSVVAGSV